MKQIRNIIAFAILLEIIFLFQKSVLAENLTYIEISSKEDLAILSEKCHLDIWSVGKKVYLKNDIDLTGAEFEPIPIFSGEFDGRGYSIKGFKISSSKQTGIFNVIGETGRVYNLNVSGNISYTGNKEGLGGIAIINKGRILSCNFCGKLKGNSKVGGIAGENDVTGEIIDCSVKGSILGEHSVGGIAGINEGSIKNTKNFSDINRVNQEKISTVEDMDFGAIPDIRRFRITEPLNTLTDIGGISGLSKGMIVGCINEGDVGYPHIGYNIGGVVGRSSGFVSNCLNKGRLNGRKDVGGIVGQMEPYLTVIASKGSLESIKKELNKLHNMVDGTLEDARLNADYAVEDLTDILKATEASIDHTYTLFGILNDYGDDATQELNRGSESIYDVVVRMKDISADFIDLSQKFSEGMKQLSKGLNELAENGKLGSDALNELKIAIACMEEAGNTLNRGLENVSSGFKELKTALKIKDDEAVKTALNKIRTGLNQISDGSSDMADTLEKILDLLQSNGIWNDEIKKQVLHLIKDLKELSSGISSVIHGLNELIDNISLDKIKAKSGIDKIISGMKGIAGATSNLKESTRHISKAVDNAAKASVHIDKSMQSIEKAFSIFSLTSEKNISIVNSIDTMLEELSNTERIRFPNSSKSIRNAGNELYDSLLKLSDEINDLNLYMSSSSDSLIGRFKEINNQASNISSCFMDMLQEQREIDLSKLYKDTSDKDIDKITNGKVFKSVNYGEIGGDINVGGISGLMAVEYDNDPEDDIVKAKSDLFNKRYETKAVIHFCKNYGDIIAKKNYVGGIAGQFSIGFISKSENYGKIVSESGDYVGGISGKADSVIRGCFVKASLSARNYIGGIAGYGSCIENSYSMPQIEDYNSFCGAISGNDNGKLKGNYFVSNEVAGMNMVSYKNKAEEIDYYKLLKRANLPKEFKKFYLTFRVDDKIIKKESFEYGASFNKEVFPVIPDKIGYYGVWDSEELVNLLFDKEVKAVYKKTINTLCTEDRRDTDKSIFLAEGNFTKEDCLSLRLLGAGSEYFKTDILSELSEKGKATFWQKRKIQQAEHWLLTIPNDNSQTHTVRFYPINKNLKNTVIYVKDNNEWEKVPFEIIGSYLVFQINGSQLEIIVLPMELNFIFITIILFSILGLGLSTFVVRRKKKSK